MNNNSEPQEDDQKKNESVLLFVKSIYEITVDKIKDPILRTILAVGILFVALAGLSMSLKAEIPKSVIWPLFLIGIVAVLFGLVKWFAGIIFENGKEKALSELRRLLRPAKSIRGEDLTQEIGSMIRDSSNEDFIINMAQRMVRNSLRRKGKRVKLPDLPTLYEMKNIPSADCMDIRHVVQTIADEVSWKHHRVYVDVITKEQILQYPSTMLLSDEIYGGCADKVILLCTLLRALKFRLRFKLAINKGKTYSHIWAEVYLPTEQGPGEWVAIDPSKPGFKIDGKEEWERYWEENFISQGYAPSESAQTYEL